MQYSEMHTSDKTEGKQKLITIKVKVVVTSEEKKRNDDLLTHLFRQFSHSVMFYNEKV